MQKSQTSLKQLLLFWVLIPLFLVLLISAIGSYYRALHFANLAYDRALFRAALALSNQVDVVGNDVVINLPQIAKDVLEYDKDDVIYYRISAPNGHLVLGTPLLTIPKTLPKTGTHAYYNFNIQNQALRVVAYSLPIQNSAIAGNILVQVAETRSKREAMVTEIVEEMLVPQVLIFGLATGLILLGIKRGLLPLQRVQEAINQRSHRDLSAINTQEAPKEIQPLLSAMNGLIQRVSESVKLQQQFIADASHQMRTPIAGLQTQAELALREQDPATIRSTLAQVLTSSSRLSHLLSRLLSMASVDPAAGREAKIQAIDLIALAKNVTGDFVGAASAKQIDLGLEVKPLQASILGDELMLHEMLANLIDNAICYTPNGGIITVCVEKNAGNIVLSVIDNGIGIAPEQRTQVFERFHRLRDNEGKGCGLGLAIVKEVVLAHNAEITISDGLPSNQHTGFGSLFKVTFNAQ